MNYGNVLPVTGGLGGMVLGHALGLDDIIVAAIAAVLFGITAYRYGSRIGLPRNTIIIGMGAFTCSAAVVAHIAGLSWGLSAAAALVVAMAILYGASRIFNRDISAVA